MAPSHFIALVVGVILSILGYIALRKTSFGFDLDIVVHNKLSTVFEHLKTPQTLPEINPYVRWVAVQNLTVTNDGVERINYLVSEEITHIGQQTWTASSVVDPAHYTIKLRAVVMYGMLRIETTYELRMIEDSLQSTLVEEMSTVEVPWILETFLNKTLLASHTQLLEMLKFVLEEKVIPDNEH